jgi:ribosomal protein L31E
MEPDKPESDNTVQAQEVQLGMADQARGFAWPHVEPLLTVGGSIKEKNCMKPILVDGGASANFVSAAFVAKNRLTARKLKQCFKVSLADGTSMISTLVLDHAKVVVPTMSNYEGHHQFMVLDGLAKYDAVLGRPFLVKSGAVVDHGSDKIHWRKRDERSRTEEKNWRRPTHERESITSSEATQRNVGDAEVELKMTCNSQSPNEPTPAPPVHIASTITPLIPHAVGNHEQRNKLHSSIEQYRKTLEPFKDQLPPNRGEFDHAINLKSEDSKPIKLPAIRQRPELARAMKEKLDEYSAKGLIRRSISKYGAPAFMVEQTSNQGSKIVKKHRLVVNFKGLNELTETNATSMPHVDELIARLSRSKVFSKLDLTSGFHQVRMHEKDISKTAFTTPFGHFEWMVMPFGEKNAPATFVQLLNQLVLVDLVHDFIIVFVDDILIFSENEDAHIEHVQAVLTRLANHRMFINPDKCTWMVNEVDFLGYRLRAGENAVELMIQENKVNAINNWPTPTTISDLRSFLGAANFSRTFVQDFSSIARPLTGATIGKHLSKSAKIAWGTKEQQAFDDLKRALTSAPALAVPDEAKQFVLYTDASDFGIGASLCQWNDEIGAMQVCAYMSAKLKGAELNWTTHEKEMYALVRALKHWSMYFVQSTQPIKIFTDNKATLDMLRSKDDIPGRRSRWATVLTRFALDPHGIKGEKNVLADGLSRRSDLNGGKEEMQSVRRQQVQEALEHLGLATMEVPSSTTCEVSSSELVESFKRAYKTDEHCMRLLKDPKRYHVNVEDGLIINEHNRILVPADANIRSAIIHETHDSILSGHLGTSKTVNRLRLRFDWHGMVTDVNEYVRSCHQCQKSKARNVNEAGLLQPISPPMTKGMTISIDFVGPVPRTARGKDFIMVIVDRFSKRVWYEPTKKTVNAKQAAKIIFDRVVRHQGLPEVIISDRDPRFNAKIWRNLWKECNTRLAMTVSFRAQANGGTETNNRVMQDMLRAFVNESRKDWDLKLAALEVAYNSSINETTGLTPFQLDIGMHPRLPLDIATGTGNRTQQTVTEFMRNWEDSWALAHEHIHKAQLKQKSNADIRRHDEQYKIGDLAWLRLDRGILNDGLSTIEKLGPRVEGPYEITELHGVNNVTLKLHKGDKRHRMFNVSQLRPFIARDNTRFPMPHERTSEDKDDDDNDPLNDEKNVSQPLHETLGTIRVRRTRRQVDHGAYIKH